MRRYCQPACRSCRLVSRVSAPRPPNFKRQALPQSRRDGFAWCLESCSRRLGGLANVSNRALRRLVRIPAQRDLAALFTVLEQSRPSAMWPMLLPHLSGDIGRGKASGLLPKLYIAHREMRFVVAEARQPRRAVQTPALSSRLSSREPLARV